MSNYTKLLNNLDTLKLFKIKDNIDTYICLLYTSPSPRDA